MWNAEGKMWNGNTVGRSCATVGKMRNAEICVCGRSYQSPSFHIFPRSAVPFLPIAVV